jgi:hypothetical protein
MRPLLEPGVGIRRGLSREWEFDASASQHLIGEVEKVEDLGHANVGDRLSSTRDSGIERRDCAAPFHGWP